MKSHVVPMSEEDLLAIMAPHELKSPWGIIPWDHLERLKLTGIEFDVHSGAIRFVIAVLPGKEDKQD